MTLLSAHAQQPIDSLRMYNLNEFETVGNHKAVFSMSKLPVPLAKLPMSVTQINGDQLRTRGISNVQDAVKFIPGANMRTSYGAFQQLSIRGFDQAPVHIDGMRDERTTFNSYPLSDLSSVESIEVLKGPAGVLFGHSAVGGAMNIVRKRASGRKEIYSKIALGSFGLRQTTLGIGGVVCGPVNYYTSLNYSNQDGYRKINDSRLNWYGTLAAKWKSDELQLRATYNKDFYATDAGLPAMLRDSVYTTDGTLFMAPYTLNPFIKNIDSRYNNESDFMYNSGMSASGKYVHHFSKDFRLTDAFMVAHDDIDYFSTEELSYPQSNEAVYPHYYLQKGKKKYIDLSHVKLTFPLRFSHVADTYQNQLDLSHRLGTDRWSHNLLLGYAVSYMRRTSYSGYDVEGEDASRFTNPGSPDVYGPGVQSLVSVEEPGSMGYMRERFSKATPSHTLTHGFYLQDLMEFGEKLQVLLSARYDHYTLMSSSALVIDRERKFKDSGKDEYRQNISQSITYRAGVVYEPIKDWQLYGSVSSFFKPDRSFYKPTVIYVDAQGKEFTPKENGSIFKPLSGYQAEVGTRVNLNSFATINASLFYIHQKNGKKTLGEETRMLNGTETKMSIIGQVGTISSKGFEIDATVYPISNMMLTAGYGFTDIRYTKLAKNSYLNVDAEEGNPLNGVPKHNFYSYGNYDISDGPIKGLSLNYSLTYTGMIYRNYVKAETYPGYAQLNAGISYRLSNNIMAQVLMNNVTNKRVFSNSLGLQPMPNQPRTLTFSLTYELR